MSTSESSTPHSAVIDTQTLPPNLLNLTNRELGTLGENLAAHYLHDRGWVIHERNYRTRYGEIDLIAREGETLVFVEVKTRRSRTFGPGIHAVTSTKLIHAKLALGQYLMDNCPPHANIRIDAIDIFLQPNAQPEITHYRSVGA